MTLWMVAQGALVLSICVKDSEKSTQTWQIVLCSVLVSP